MTQRDEILKKPLTSIPLPSLPTEIVLDDGESQTRSRAGYSIFSRSQKNMIVFLVALAASFSTLSSFIYFPAITPLAESLHTTVGNINLTVTSYMIVSAVIPSIVGNAADISGRRPLFLLALAIYLVANIGLAVQRSFPALLTLRMLQSAGISGTQMLRNDLRRALESCALIMTIRNIFYCLWSCVRHRKSSRERLFCWHRCLWVIQAVFLTLLTTTIRYQLGSLVPIPHQALVPCLVVYWPLIKAGDGSSGF